MQIQKILLGLAIIIAISGITMAFKEYQARKNYSVSLPLEEWSKHIQGIEITKVQLRNSDLPAKQVTYITDSILSPIQIAISQQVNATLTAEKKATDSIAKPKKN